MRDRIACSVLALALAISCGGDADDAASDEPSQARPADPKSEVAAPSGGAADLWAPISPTGDAAPLPARDPKAPLDPDAVIARFEQECAGGASGSDCRALRRDLELVFFADLLGLRRGGQHLDRELVRAAARARLPQLACFGLRELLFASGLTSEDERLITDALDSPWRAPREIVRAFVYRRAVPVKGISDLYERDVEAAVGSSAALCVDGGRDPERNPALAGNYPGARYRAFASKPDLGWFTTSDPPEKVLAFLTRGGKSALTADELKAARQAAYMDEMVRLTSGESASDDPDITAKMMELALETSFDWTAPFANIQRVGEIRYVLITPKQAVAVFRDDALGATSIVAPRPPAFDRAALGL
jgi:hypothetical protein